MYELKLLILNLYIFLFSNLLQNIGICYIWTYMALRRTYGFKGMEDMGPVYKSMEVKDGAAILSFDYAKDGFNRLKGMEGFEIAGDDKVFYPAEAEVYNNLQIKVKSDKVKNPVAVRYCFRDFKPGNVANLRELPMYPFRTDNWE